MELNNNQKVLLALRTIHPKKVVAADLKSGLVPRKTSVTLNNLKTKGLTESEPLSEGNAHRWGLTPAGLAYAERLSGDKVRTERVQAHIDKKVQAKGPMPEPTPTPPAPPSSTLAQVLDQMAKQVVDGIVNHMMVGLQERVKVQLEAEFEQALKKLPERVLASLPAIPEQIRVEAPPPAPAKKRVTVVGLLNGQVEMMRKEFGKELDLHFVEVNKDPGRLKSLSATSHAVVTMTDFLRHSDEQLIKAAGGTLIRVTGGMTSLRDKLTEIYVN